MSVPFGKPKTETRIRKEPAPPFTVQIPGTKKLGGLFGGRGAYRKVIQRVTLITEERITQEMTDSSIKLIQYWKEIHREIKNSK